LISSLSPQHLRQHSKDPLGTCCVIIHEKFTLKMDQRQIVRKQQLRFHQMHRQQETYNSIKTQDKEKTKHPVLAPGERVFIDIYESATSGLMIR